MYAISIDKEYRHTALYFFILQLFVVFIWLAELGQYTSYFWQKNKTNQEIKTYLNFQISF